MENRSTDEALPSGCEGELRRLRFASHEVERAFQDDYARRTLPQLRLIAWVTLFLQIPLTLRAVVFDHWGLAEPRFWFRLVSGCTPAVLRLLLFRSPRSARWSQPYMLLAALFIGTTLMVMFAPLPLGWTRLTTFLAAACIVFRLQTRPAALVAALVIAGYTSVAVGVLHRPLHSLSESLVTLTLISFFLLFGNYLIESAARRDFLLSRLLAQEREKSERLLLNVLPASVAARLKEDPGTVADSFEDVTVLFADIVDFTPLSAQLSPEGTVKLLNEVFSRFDRLAGKHGLEKIKTIGDAYMVVGGLPEPRADHAGAVMAMAIEMQDEIARFRGETGEPLQLRVGIHSGPVVAGVIGTKKFSYDLWGDTVNLASRMESHGLPGAIQVTDAGYQRLQDRYAFTARRIANVKGKGEMTAYLLAPAARGSRAEESTPSGVEVSTPA